MQNYTSVLAFRAANIFNLLQPAQVSLQTVSFTSVGASIYLIIFVSYSTVQRHASFKPVVVSRPSSQIKLEL